MLYVDTGRAPGHEGRALSSDYPIPHPNLICIRTMLSCRFLSKVKLKPPTQWPYCQGWWLAKMEPRYRLVSASMSSGPYYLGSSRSWGGGISSWRDQFLFLMANLAWELLLSPKTSVSSLLTHMPGQPEASLCPPPSYEWVPISFSKSRCHSGVPATTSNWKTNSSIREHCAQQVSQAPGNANWSFKRWKDSWRILWCFGECLWADRPVTSSFQIVTIQSHLLQRTDFSHLTIGGSCPCSFSPKSWREFGIMIPRQMHGFLAIPPIPWCLWTDKQAQTGGKGTLLMVTLELESWHIEPRECIPPLKVPTGVRGEKNQIVRQEVV